MSADTAVKAVKEAEKLYPRRLAPLENPPKVLYGKGDLSLLNCQKSFAIVGTRKASTYALQQAGRAAYELAESGFVIISGLALGIDSEAHRGALQAKGKTIAVLGNAIDSIYPPQNESLAEKIIKNNGLILSEYPPETVTQKYNFLYRNRIIAGLGDYLFVVEAPERSGALVTAGFAADYGREVFALPGDISRCQSKGSNNLIASGAQCVCSIDRLLEAVGATSKKIKISSEDEKILSAIVTNAGNFDKILTCLALNSAELNVELMRLEIAGLVKKDNLGKYIVVNYE